MEPRHYNGSPVFVRGGGVGEVAHQVLVLLAIGLLMSAWAVQSYKKNG